MQTNHFDDFAKDFVACRTELLEDCDIDDVVSELRGLCHSALGDSPSNTAIKEIAIAPFMSIKALRPTKFLVLTIARTSVIHELLGDLLAKRFRFFIYKTWRGRNEAPAIGRAPGEAPWEIVAELLAAREKPAIGRRNAASLDALHGGKLHNHLSTEARWADPLEKAWVGGAGPGG